MYRYGPVTKCIKQQKSNPFLSRALSCRLYPITLFNRESESRRARGLYVLLYEPRGAAAARFLLWELLPRHPVWGSDFGCRPGGPLRRVPGPGTPAALPARHTATALTPPQTSWMRSRCPAVRTLHYAEPMRCCDLPRCLHSQAHVCPSHGLATPSHRRVPRATPRCPATCLTSRARVRSYPTRVHAAPWPSPMQPRQTPLRLAPRERHVGSTASIARVVVCGTSLTIVPRAHLHSSHRAGPQRPSIQRPKKPIFLLCSSTSGVVSRSAVQLADEPRLW